MPQNFIAAEREQQFLLPPDMRDWLPTDHLAWFVLDTVAELDLSAFYARYRDDGWGRAAFEPKLMVALLLYGYLTGVRSSRGIERRCREDIGFRVIASNHVPDHATIARFMVRHEDDLKGVFDEVLRLCAAAGLLRVGVVAIDGTKIEAAASDRNNYDAARLKKLIDDIFAEAKALDEQGDRLYGDKRGDELPDELADPGTRKEAIRRARKRLKDELDKAERAQSVLDEHTAAEHADYEEKLARWTHRSGRAKGRKPKAPQDRRRRAKQVNLTDLDAKIMKDGKRWMTGYNAQMIATEDLIVIANDVSSVASDSSQLRPLLDQAETNLHHCGVNEPVATMLGDAGYFSKQNVFAGPDMLIAVTPRSTPQRLPTRDKETVEMMLGKLQDPHNRQLYNRRSQMTEPIFGHVKANRGVRRFLRRGLKACATEWSLLMTANNLMKLRSKRTGELSQRFSCDSLAFALG